MAKRNPTKCRTPGCKGDLLDKTHRNYGCPKAQGKVVAAPAAKSGKATTGSWWGRRKK